jgi:CcmD family protein
MPSRLVRLVRPFAMSAVLAAALLLGAAAAVPAPALAQDAAEERSQSFRAVEGAVKEDVPGGPLLVAAYAAIWLVVLAYVFRLVRLQQRAQSDVARLERLLAQGAPRDPGAG